MAVLGVLALSVTSSRAQTLDLTGGAVEKSLTNEVLYDTVSSANDGAVSTWVVSDTSADPSGLIFIYQLENSGPDTIGGVNFNQFSSGELKTEGSYSSITGLTLLGAQPADPDGGFTFDFLSSEGAATFSGDLSNGGTYSWFIVIDTDVNSFDTGYALAQDNFQAHGDILAPNYAVFGVPEPSSAVILLGGFACFYGILRCRRAMD